MARPKAFTAKQMEDSLRESRGLVTVAARKLGCAPNTVRKYIADYKSVKQVVEDSRESLIDAAELRLAQAVEVRGDAWAIAYVLSTLGRHRGFVKRSEQELSGLSGGPIETRTTYYLPQKNEPPDPGTQGAEE